MGAVVVGGVNIFGGSGSVIGVLLGATMIDLLDSSLVRWELVSEFWREAVSGHADSVARSLWTPCSHAAF